MKTDAATPSFVSLAMLGPEVHCGKDTPIRLCQPCAMHVHDPNNVARAVQTDPTLLHHASAITEKRKLKSLTGLKPQATTPMTCNYMQQGVQSDTSHVTSNNVASVCTVSTSITYRSV